MRFTAKKSMEERLLSADEYAGLAKEAAKKPLASAITDATYFISLAEKAGKPLDTKTQGEVWEIFSKSQNDRIKHMQEQVEKYKHKKTPEALAQLEWYARELERVKEFRMPVSRK